MITFWQRPTFGMYLGFLLTTMLALVSVAFRRPWQFGLAMPVGKIWWAFLPLAALAGVISSVSPLSLPHAITPAWGIWLLSLLMAPVALELLFRSLVHGLLAQSARISRPKSRILLSWPMVGASLLFAGYTLWQTSSGVSLAYAFWSARCRTCMPVCGAFLLGLVLGVVRERSQSIIPPIIFHMVAIGAAAGRHPYCALKRHSAYPPSGITTMAAFI